MAKVERFEDLIAWQKARLLTCRIYEVSRIGDFSRDFGLARQIQRAAVAIMSNIAEGFERWDRTEFHRSLFIAKSACAEVRSELYVALDLGYLDEPTFESLMIQAEEVARIVGGLRAAVAPPKEPRD